MRTKLFPLVSLMLALFFGVRTTNHSDQAAPGNPAPPRSRSTNPLKQKRPGIPIENCFPRRCKRLWRRCGNCSV